MHWIDNGVRRLSGDVRNGRRTAEEALTVALERADRLEPAVRSLVRRHDDWAAERARGLDRRREAGEELGPLAGVPVVLKDNIGLEGWPLTCGSRILEGYVAADHATVVQRLLEADAVPFAQANMDEFAMGSSCESSAFGATRNPWDLERVPGGSSGGSAAAVAAGIAPLALGSDTGGSIRQPAALCGVVGLKPSWGRVSRYGLVAFASSLDQIGPLGRSVDDVALAYGVLAGHDPLDSTSSREPVTAPELEGRSDLRGLRLGVLRQVRIGELGEAVGANWRQVLDDLGDLGAELIEVDAPSVDAAVATYYVLANSEASANLARFDGIRYGRRSGRGSLEELYVASRSEGFGPEVKRRIVLGTFALSQGYAEKYYEQARGLAARMRTELDAALERVDALVTPTSPTSAFALGERTEDPLSMYLSDVFTTPASLAGLPALAVPCGSDDVGLPLSLQITGPAFGEAAVLAIGAVWERHRGSAEWPPLAGGRVLAARARGDDGPWSESDAPVS